MKESPGLVNDQPFFTSNPLGLPYNPLPEIDPHAQKREETWLEIAVEGWGVQMSGKIGEMKASLAELDFEGFMDAFEELENTRHMQLQELIREMVEMKRNTATKIIEKELPTPSDYGTFKKRPKSSSVPPNPVPPPTLELPAKSKKDGRKNPVLIVAGVIAGLVILFLGFSSNGTPSDQPKPTPQRVDLQDMERRQIDRGVEEALKYQSLAPSKSYDREADEKLEAWVDQQNAIQASRDAAAAADEARYAAEDAAADARAQHQEQMQAIESALEDAEEARRLDSYRKRLR